MVADHFARLGDVHQQFTRSVLVGGQREIGAGDSSFAAEQMAGGATGLAIERLASRQIALPFQQRFDFEEQLFGVPILDEQPRGQRRLGTNFGSRVEDWLQRGLLGMRQRGHRILANVGNEFGEVRRLLKLFEQEPTEEFLASPLRPAFGDRPQTDGISQLLFLRGGFLEQREDQLRRQRRLPTRQQLSHFRIQSIVVRRQRAVQFVEQLRFHFSFGIAESHGDDLQRANRIEPRFRVELCPVQTLPAMQHCVFRFRLPQSSQRQRRLHDRSRMSQSQCLVLPRTDRAELQQRSRGEADEAVVVRQTFESQRERGVVRRVIRVLQFVTERSQPLRFRVFNQRRLCCAFGPGVGHAIQSTVRVPAASGEIQRPIRSDHDVGRLRAVPFEEHFLPSTVGRTGLLQMHRVQLAVGPIGEEQSLLIPRGKLRSVSECNSGRTAATHVDDRRQ